MYYISLENETYIILLLKALDQTQIGRSKTSLVRIIHYHKEHIAELRTSEKKNCSQKQKHHICMNTLKDKHHIYIC